MSRPKQDFVTGSAEQELSQAWRDADSRATGTSRHGESNQRAKSARGQGPQPRNPSLPLPEGNGEDWSGEGDKAEWRAQQIDRLVRPLKRQLPQMRGPDQPRARSRSLSVSAKAKQMKLWSIKSKTNASCRNGFLDLFCAMKRKHGKAKQWPVDAEIFTGEGKSSGSTSGTWAGPRTIYQSGASTLSRKEPGKPGETTKRVPRADFTLGPDQGQHQVKTQRTP